MGYIAREDYTSPQKAQRVSPLQPTHTHKKSLSDKHTHTHIHRHAHTCKHTQTHSHVHLCLQEATERPLLIDALPANGHGHGQPTSTQSHRNTDFELPFWSRNTKEEHLIYLGSRAGIHDVLKLCGTTQIDII